MACCFASSQTLASVGAGNPWLALRQRVNDRHKVKTMHNEEVVRSAGCCSGGQGNDDCTSNFVGAWECLSSGCSHCKHHSVLPQPSYSCSQSDVCSVHVLPSGSDWSDWVPGDLLFAAVFCWAEFVSRWFLYPDFEIWHHEIWTRNTSRCTTKGKQACVTKRWLACLVERWEFCVHANRTKVSSVNQLSRYHLSSSILT